LNSFDVVIASYKDLDEPSISDAYLRRPKLLVFFESENELSRRTFFKLYVHRYIQQVKLVEPLCVDYKKEHFFEHQQNIKGWHEVSYTEYRTFMIWTGKNEVTENRQYVIR
jgi:hypothetical protein